MDICPKHFETKTLLSFVLKVSCLHSVSGIKNGVWSWCPFNFSPYIHFLLNLNYPRPFEVPPRILTLGDTDGDTLNGSGWGTLDGTWCGTLNDIGGVTLGALSILDYPLYYPPFPTLQILVLIQFFLAIFKDSLCTYQLILQSKFYIQSDWVIW